MNAASQSCQCDSFSYCVAQRTSHHQCLIVSFQALGYSIETYRNPFKNHIEAIPKPKTSVVSVFVLKTFHCREALLQDPNFVRLFEQLLLQQGLQHSLLQLAAWLGVWLVDEVDA